MITGARLVNWRSHADSRLEFTDGTNVLVGVIGSGKSSVLDAICFGLFGTFPALQSRKVRLEDLLRNRPREEEKGSVEVNFRAGGKDYTVSREIKRGKTTTSEIREAGKLIEGPAAASVTRKVEALLKVSYDLFSRAIYSEQNRMDYFLTIPKGKRMQGIDELLNIHVFEAARKNAASLANQMRAGSAESERLLSGFMKSSEEDEEKIKGRIKELEKEVSSAKKKLEKSEAEKTKIEKEFASAEKEFEKFAERRGKIEREAEEAKEELGELEKNSREKIRLASEKEKIEEANPEIPSELKKLENKYASLQKKIAKLENRKEFLEKNKGELSGEACPLCRTKLEADKMGELRQENEKELKEVKEKISGMTGELKEAENEREKLAGIWEELEGINEGLKDIGKPDERIVVVKKGLKEKEASLQKLKFDGGKYDLLKKEYGSLLRGWSDANAEHEAARRQLEEVRHELEKFSEQKKELDEKERELKKLKSGADFLLRFQNSLKLAQEELRRHFVTSVNEAMHELWQGIYPYGDFVGIRLGIEGGDYVLQLESQDGGWVDVEGVVSGGERSTAALVLRMAFALVLAPHLKILILDEPTHNLDRRGVEELANTLRERAAGYVSQVFLITHEERLEAAVSGNLYKLERDKESEEPTRVTLVT